MGIALDPKNDKAAQMIERGRTRRALEALDALAQGIHSGEGVFRNRRSQSGSSVVVAGLPSPRGAGFSGKLTLESKLAAPSAGATMFAFHKEFRVASTITGKSMFRNKIPETLSPGCICNGM